MSYPIETKICSKNGWFTPAEAKAYYGSYNRHGLTVHWWGGGEGADQHDHIVDYFMGQAEAGIKSVNYVVSDNKITKMVEPDNVAWASESGNAVSVSVEFQPTLTAEGYKRGGWLIAELEKKYGTLQLYKHSFWFPTACPGTIDLSKLRAAADVAKGEDMAINRGRAIRLLRLTRRGVTETKIAALVGQDEDKWLDSVYYSSWFKEQTAKISMSYQALKDKIISFVKGA